MIIKVYSRHTYIRTYIRVYYPVRLYAGNQIWMNKEMFALKCQMKIRILIKCLEISYRESALNSIMFRKLLKKWKLSKEIFTKNQQNWEKIFEKNIVTYLPFKNVWNMIS